MARIEFSFSQSLRVLAITVLGAGGTGFGAEPSIGRKDSSGRAIFQAGAVLRRGSKLKTIKAVVRCRMGSGHDLDG